ncbi:MAG: ATP-dependent helicase [Anaerolineae bacterium]|nr:ATP-dependent helicase [Anaerolineae bacterium]
MSEYWKRLENIRQDIEQQKVFDEDVSRVVIAGPGSGKTYLLTTKVAKLLHTGIVKTPHRIACLTYSNFLASQLSQDLQALEVLDDERIFVGTVHSFCIGEVILPFQKLYQLRVPTPLRIASKEEEAEAIQGAIGAQGLEPPNVRDRSLKLDDLITVLRRYRRLYWDRPSTKFPEITPKIRQRYPNLNWAKFAEDYLTSLLETDQPCVDFVHLEIEALKTIQTYPLVQLSLAARFKWWVIDEYQDLGQPFHQIVLCLLQNTPLQVLAIGDPDQCIYEELQGSKPELIHELSRVIQERGGSEAISLKTNYRSTQQIINLSEVMVEGKRGYLARKTQQGGDRIYCISCQENMQLTVIQRLLRYLVEKEEGPQLQVDQILILHPHRKGRAGINSIANGLENNDWLNKLDKDPDYNERKVGLIEWVEQLAYWCAKDSMLHRPYFTDLLPVWIELVEHYQGYTLLGERFKHEKQLFEALWNLRDAAMNLREWLDALRERLQLDQIVESYGSVRPDDAKEFFHLCQAARTGNRLPTWDIARFAQTGQRIQLTTLHSSKGAQFEAVIVAGFDKIGFGNRRYSPEALDKRLAYVGVTRAKKYLFLLHSGQNAYFVSRVNNASREIVELYEYNGQQLRRRA